MRKKIAFYFSMLLLMFVAITQFEFNTIRAASCCNYGENCGTLSCCYPYTRESPCSSSQPNYCRRVCGPNPN